MPVSFRPLKGRFGAEVVGIDPTLTLDEATFRSVEEAWYRHSILLFRGLTMSPEQHIDFTRRLGPLHIMTPPQYNLPDHPEVFVVANADYLNWDAFGYALARHVRYCNSDHRDQRIAAAEQRHPIAA